MSNTVQGNFIGTDPTERRQFQIPATAFRFKDLLRTRSVAVIPAKATLSRAMAAKASRFLMRHPNIVQGNFIGVDASGAISAGMGNGSHGVEIYQSASNNIIGVGSCDCVQTQP